MEHNENIVHIGHVVSASNPQKIESYMSIFGMNHELGISKELDSEPHCITNLDAIDLYFSNRLRFDSVCQQNIFLKYVGSLR